ncbi:hypothetical protein CPB83DRAFT_691398 [Crepidotus variabilis]|uniref:Uncharacterized protein n=1 Tax=Crepidotus variabilis TaxID=179855 RepID=A0A9P6E6B7_9AGAR|nr:hypothetical protein CPB83DRAFT_691398 [Crepidotus variabilis]
MPLINPSESVLYPTSYYRDMAFFTTQFMSHKFDRRNHCVYDKSLLIHSAAYDDFSDWERRLYNTVLRTFQLAECDESLPIGTIVLLDLLKDLADSGQKVHAEGDKANPVLTLPPYPHEDYIDLFMGAFMLAYRLLSKNCYPLQPERWARILGGEISDKRVVQLEEQFRDMLDNHINVYQPPRFTDRDDHIRAVYAQKEIFTVPANPFIPAIRYMKTKVVMYAHIRLRMRLRGQQPIIVGPVVRGRLILNLSVAYPPCHQEMLFRQAMLNNVRTSVKRLKKASDREVYLFIMGHRARTDERFDEVMFSSMGLGYNIPGLDDFEQQTVGNRRVLKLAGKGHRLREWIEA